MLSFVNDQASLEKLQETGGLFSLRHNHLTKHTTQKMVNSCMHLCLLEISSIVLASQTLSCVPLTLVILFFLRRICWCCEEEKDARMCSNCISYALCELLQLFHTSVVLRDLDFCAFKVSMPFRANGTTTDWHYNTARPRVRTLVAIKGTS